MSRSTALVFVVLGAAVAGFAYKSILESTLHEPPVTGRTGS